MVRDEKRSVWDLKEQKIGWHAPEVEPSAPDDDLVDDGFFFLFPLPPSVVSVRGR